MKSIMKVEIDTNHKMSYNNRLIITHQDGYFQILNLETTDNKENSLIISDYNGWGNYSYYPKKELIKIQILLLQAYVFSHDKLEEAVANNEAKDLLDKLKNKVKVVRKQLRHLTNYIDSYDEMLKEYKDV